MLSEAALGWDLRAIGFVAGAGLFWLQYFDLKDRLKREPRRLLIFSYFIGALAAVLALFTYWLVEKLGGPVEPGYQHTAILIYCFLVVGPIEEGAKFFLTRSLVLRTRYFDEPIDGLVYSSAVSIGFASFEILWFAEYLPWIEQLARALTSPLTHSLFASIWGFGTAHAFFRVRSTTNRRIWQAGTLLAAMAAHAVYDFVLLAYNATFIASGIALFLWALLIVYARSLVFTAPARSAV
jgi:RsiW-degrading membrane proteinase PrsW (M82 family)